VEGLAHERDSASDKCTMINPNGQRHLRDVPSAPIVRSFSEVPQVAAPPTQGQVAGADSSRAGSETPLSFSPGMGPLNVVCPIYVPAYSPCCMHAAVSPFLCRIKIQKPDPKTWSRLAEGDNNTEHRTHD
jgi:hypothetical protein